MAAKENLNNILRSFKVKAECLNHSKVRNVSLYDLRLEPGTRVREIQKFSDEIALSLKAKARPLIKIISELGIVRLEVIDETPFKISYFDEMSYIDIPTGNIPMYLGSSVNGQNIWVDMAKNPHLLIAGTTGSGKSTLLHIIMANAFRLGIKVCLIDSKNVEFNEYKHFNNVDIASDYLSGLKLINILIEEMENRYKIMNTSKYNNLNFKNILFIVDEFADLILQDDSKIFYNCLCRLAQKSRAAGIYCILATQRPSTDIIRGSIKANFPARISCQVASNIDSKVILDASGAELLAGCGDSIIKNYNNNYQRFQIAYTNPDEVCKFYAREDYF
jgi:DNA segregation ATPase FtsK/SpoIIIE, S-DNA-T family